MSPVPGCVGQGHPEFEVGRLKWDPTLSQKARKDGATQFCEFDGGYPRSPNARDRGHPEFEVGRLKWDPTLSQKARKDGATQFCEFDGGYPRSPNAWDRGTRSLRLAG